MEKLTIGIDISAKTLDICIKQALKEEFLVIENEISAIKKFFKKFKDNENIVVSMENTGRYNWNLYEVLEKFDFKVFVINSLHLKKSLGLQRGKNDKIDAQRIAEFTLKNEQELMVWKPSTEAMKKLKVLLSERKSKIKLKTSLLQQRKNYNDIKSIGLGKKLLKINDQEIKLLEEHIVFLEKEMQNVIESDEDLREKNSLIRSIPGVGKVLTWMILVKTENFTTITEARKMACYSGVVPFDHQSGSSIRFKPKVSIFADKSLKSILHMASISVIQGDNDLQKYYQRKVLEGKNKMLVLNNIRNKIIHRIFAVVKSGKSYDKNYINNLQIS
jgi:transposase